MSFGSAASGLGSKALYGGGIAFGGSLASGYLNNRGAINGPVTTSGSGSSIDTHGSG